MSIDVDRCSLIWKSRSNSSNSRIKRSSCHCPDLSGHHGVCALQFVLPQPFFFIQHVSSNSILAAWISGLISLTIFAAFFSGSAASKSACCCDGESGCRCDSDTKSRTSVGASDRFNEHNRSPEVLCCSFSRTSAASCYGRPCASLDPRMHRCKWWWGPYIRTRIVQLSHSFRSLLLFHLGVDCPPVIVIEYISVSSWIIEHLEG